MDQRSTSLGCNGVVAQGCCSSGLSSGQRNKTDLRPYIPLRTVTSGTIRQGLQKPHEHELAPNVCMHTQIYRMHGASTIGVARQTIWHLYTPQNNMRLHAWKVRYSRTFMSPMETSMVMQTSFRCRAAAICARFFSEKTRTIVNNTNQAAVACACSLVQLVRMSCYCQHVSAWWVMHCIIVRRIAGFYVSFWYILYHIDEPVTKCQL